MTYLLISHNIAVVEAMADRIAVMREGRIVELGRSEQVISSPEHPYTKLLLDAVPRLAGAT
jgi:peptide/nickel transport system ATP-binding protein